MEIVINDEDEINSLLNLGIIDLSFDLCINITDFRHLTFSKQTISKLEILNSNSYKVVTFSEFEYDGFFKFSNSYYPSLTFEDSSSVYYAKVNQLPFITDDKAIFQICKKIGVRCSQSFWLTQELLANFTKWNVSKDLTYSSIKNT